MVSATDLNWKIIGANDPYFGVLTCERFLRNNMAENDRQAFFETGRSDVDFIAHHLSGVERIESVLDFGCGVGRLSIALAEKFRNVVGVDISPAMLDEARKNATQFGATNTSFLSEFPGHEFDLAVSYIVFQHIQPHQGMHLLKTLLERVKIGGQVAIQITFFRSGKKKRRWFHFGFKRTIKSTLEMVGLRKLAGLKHAIRMHDYNASEVLELLFATGFTTISLVKTDHGGYAGAWIFGQRR